MRGPPDCDLLYSGILAAAAFLVISGSAVFVGAIIVMIAAVLAAATLQSHLRLYHGVNVRIIDETGTATIVQNANIICERSQINTAFYPAVIRENLNRLAFIFFELFVKAITLHNFLLSPKLFFLL